MRGSVVTQNHEAGVAVFGSALTLEGSAITDQLELDGAFGRGVAVLANRADLWPSTATIVASVLSGNVEVGLSVVGSHVDAVGLLVERTAHTAQGALGAGVSVEIDAASFIRGTANISDSVITDSFTSGVLAFAADVSLSHSLVANVEPAPTEGGIFGDGLTILNLGGQPTFVVSNSAIVAAARAGAASFGGLMDVERTLFDCAAIDLAAEPFGGVPADIRDLGGNVCGCATGPDAGETHACKALSATLSPPDPPPAL
jgi:hypothetical protein